MFWWLHVRPYLHLPLGHTVSIALTRDLRLHVFGRWFPVVRLRNTRRVLDPSTLSPWHVFRRMLAGGLFSIHLLLAHARTFVAGRHPPLRLRLDWWRRPHLPLPWAGRPRAV